MAQNTYAIVLKNDSSGNFGAAVWINPTTLPAGGTRGEINPVPYFPNVTAFQISAATNATPIAITTTASHGLTTGDFVVIKGALGNTAANGTFQVTVTGAATLTLDGSVGNAAYTNTAANYATLQKVPLTGNINDIAQRALEVAINNRSSTV